MTLSAGTRLGPYEVIAPLGAGGMGEVYRARDTRLGRDVALKVLPEDFAGDADRLRAFDREAKAVAALNHPNILTIHDVGVHEGSPYVVMELLEGENLREVVARRNPTQRQVLGWAMQTAQGLATAHQKGIIHRDLKPENLFVTADGRIKILDFGLAKQIKRAAAESEAMTASGATGPGVVMGTLAYMSPEQAQAWPVDARSDIFSFGVVLYELLSGRHPFRRETVAATLSAILQETPPPLTAVDASIPRALDGIVSRCLEKRREERFQGAHDLGLALEAVLAAPAGSATLTDVVERSPYPGLSSFTEKDASVFFGREAEVKALWERIRTRLLLAVIGPSGAGKTSFVRAGVMAARPDGWGAVWATPGVRPALGLAQALTPELAGDTEAMTDLLRGVTEVAESGESERVVSAVRRWRSRHAEALLVFDQFEELFTLSPEPVRERFLALLLRLCAEADVHVLLSLRDDFLIRCSEHDSLAPVFEALTPLAPLTRKGLQSALVEPAGKRGYRFEDDALVMEMVESVDGTRAALPLLAFAVSRLWEMRDRERKLLTRSAYEEIGGVAGALAQHAEAALDRIGGDRQNLVREIFRNLVTAEGTRAVCDREELLSVFPDRVAAEDVLRQLVDARLITSYELETRGEQPGRHRVEIVHESLLKTWPRLVRWQAQDEEGALLRDQVKQAARLWDEKGRTGDLLWTGTAYQEFELWRGRYPGALTSLEEQFAKGMGDKARRKKRIARAITAAVVVTLAGIAAAIGVSRHRVVLAARRAEASKLLALAQLKLEEDPTEALALATASLELADMNEARLFAVRALAQEPPAWEVPSDISSCRMPAFSPNGRYLAVAGHSAEVGVWEENGGPPIRLPGHEPSARGPNLAAWASDDLLVTGLAGSLGRQVYVWSIPAGKKLRTIDFGASTSWQVGPGRLFCESETPSSPRALDLRSWRLPDGGSEVLGNVDAKKLGATSSFFEPNGQGWLYTVGTATRFLPLPVDIAGDRVFSRHAAKVKFHDVLLRRLFQHDESGENRLVSFPENGPPVTMILPKPASAPPSVEGTPSGRWLSGNPREDIKLRLWDTTSLPGARPLELRRDGPWNIAGFAFHPAGNLVIATTHNLSRLTFWPVPQRPPIVIDGYETIRRPVAFSPDGKWLATSWADGRLRLWPLPGSGLTEVKVLGVPAIVGLWTGLAFDPNGKYLFAVGGGSNAWIVPLDGSPGRKLDESSGDTVLFAAAVSPTGRRVATAVSAGKGPKTLRVWDVETDKAHVFELPVPPAPSGTPQTLNQGGVGSLAFLDDSTIFTGGDGGIRRWNLDTGKHEIIRSARGDGISMSSDRGELLFCEGNDDLKSVVCGAINLSNGAVRSLAALADADIPTTQGPAFALVGEDGLVRLGLRSGGGLHLLVGHKGTLERVAISPDLRWVASTGEDNTLRLWPMPDLSKPPLHTLPHAELLAKLKSLTNIRAVRDAASPTGWKIDLGPFPGWKNLPSWEP